MASKKSKFETKYTFKGNSKLNNKYANIYEDIEKKKDAFYICQILAWMKMVSQ